jgi:hypothetical protein
MGRDYDEIVKRAANEAGGNAFVTDYAGPASIMKGVLYDGSLSNGLEAIARATTPPDALDAIGRTSLPRDSRLLEILRVYIPEPDVLKQKGIDERQFYNQLRSYWQQYQAQFAPFDAHMLAAALEARFVTPLSKAQALFDDFPTLTRLRTFISPEEMSVDPLFVMNPSLPEVPLLRTAKAFLVCGAQQFTRCEAPVRLELPAGGVVWLKAGGDPSSCRYGAQNADTYQGTDVMNLPALASGWKRDESGPGVQRFNNHDEIDRQLTLHNTPIISLAKGGDCGCSLGGRGRGGAAFLLVAVVVVSWRRRRAIAG